MTSMKAVEMQSLTLPFNLNKRLIIIVGGFGSGKSEVSVNLALYLASLKLDKISLADLDVINPYFRSREAIEQLSESGVHSLVPTGAQAQADLPIILPEIKGGIMNNDGILILDVGGDDLGSRVLSSLSDAIKPETYELILVHNKLRPFTSTLDGSLQTIREIEAASSLSFTGIISNTHLMNETTVDIINDGLILAEEVARAYNLKIKCLSMTSNMKNKIDENKCKFPILELHRALLKPWERSEKKL